MGRHSAATAAETRSLEPVGPVTDPRLFDRPMPSAERRTEHERVPSQPAQVTSIPPQAQAAALRDADDLVVDESPAGVSFAPVAVRRSAPGAADPIVPVVSSASLLGPSPARRPQQRYLRTGPIPIVTDAPRRSAFSFTRRRETALAAAALAVVGAMSGAAALLPSNESDAQAATKLDTVSAPMPRVSRSSCATALPLARSVRERHRFRATPITKTAALVGAGSAAAASMSGSSASSSASTSSTPSTSSSTAPASTRSPSRSTAPLRALPGPVGALPLSPSSLGAGTYALRDFVSQSSGAVISGGTLRGAGVGRTVVQMAANSSTRAASVPGNGNNQGGLANPVNPLYLLRGVSDLENVTVQGTQQGHLYNGLYMTGANPVIRHVQINDIPGNSNANPGETFAVGVNRASGTGTVDDLTINGGSGALSSAVGLAINNSDADWNITDLTANHLTYSAGIALWQVRGTMNIRHYVQRGGARSLGAERMAGTVNLIDPDWSAGTTGHDVTYTWDGGFSGGSINFRYSSAAQVPKRKIVILTNKASGIAGSVHVYIGGVQQTTSAYVTVD